MFSQFDQFNSDKENFVLVDTGGTELKIHYYYSIKISNGKIGLVTHHYKNQ